MKEKQQKATLDRMVEKVGTGVASRTTRRGFLGKLGIATSASFFGSAVILGEKNPAWATDAPEGCFAVGRVNVCYSPWKVTGSEAGINGVYVRRGPSFSAPICYTGSGLAVNIPVNGHFGRQSNRYADPTGCSSAGCCPDPNPRVNCNGFLWGYWADCPGGYEKQGWIPYSVSGVTYSQGDTGWSGYCCGPGINDFDCRDGNAGTAGKRVHCPSYAGCGTNSGNPSVDQYYDAYYSVNDAGSDAANCGVQNYIRFAPISTTFGWFVPADKFKRYCRMDHTDGYPPPNNHWWFCGTAYCCQWLPRGCRGWMRDDAATSISQPSNCPGAGCCPSGSLY